MGLKYRQCYQPGLFPYVRICWYTFLAEPKKDPLQYYLLTKYNCLNLLPNLTHSYIGNESEKQLSLQEKYNVWLLAFIHCFYQSCVILELLTKIKYLIFSRYSVIVLSKFNNIK